MEPVALNALVFWKWPVAIIDTPVNQSIFVLYWQYYIPYQNGTYSVVVCILHYGIF